MKKYWQLIKYSLASLSSFALDTGLFYLFKRFVFGSLGAWADLACTVAARVLSSFYNFNVNNRLVFGHRGEYGKALGRYYLLAVPLMLASAGFVTLLDRSLGVTAPGLSTAIKIGVDTVLFLASYLIQKKWVFKKKEET
ncbi:MAG: GtrA family protein [Oscillospiraceae bacterium]|nr:GtrA family protein [Oscillospiraceae bacterium]